MGEWVSEWTDGWMDGWTIMMMVMMMMMMMIDDDDACIVSQPSLFLSLSLLLELIIIICRFYHAVTTYLLDFSTLSLSFANNYLTLLVHYIT